MGAGAGRGCRAAGDADAWSPRGESVLTRSGRGAATGAARGGRSQRAGLGRGEVGWSGAGALLARWAGFGRGPEARRRLDKEGKAFFKYIFKEFLHAIFQILF